MCGCGGSGPKRRDTVGGASGVGEIVIVVKCKRQVQRRAVGWYERGVQELDGHGEVDA